jgi:uncharacterized DUF497 family protein
MDRFEWDEAKNVANWLKHGISFDLIVEFDWVSAFIKADDRFEYGEERLLAYGRIRGDGYAVVYVERGDRIRLISLRRAHEKEMRRYER